MKHLKSIIKKYNENNNLDYYQEVTSSEYHSIRGERERLLFTDDEKATIKKIAAQKGFDFSIKSWLTGEAICVGQDGNIKALYKYDDEWYIVVSYSETKLNNARYYKCDQFDGLLKCLNDI
jgi:hypothetical protein